MDEDVLLTGACPLGIDFLAVEASRELRAHSHLADNYLLDRDSSAGQNKILLVSSW